MPVLLVLVLANEGLVRRQMLTAQLLISLRQNIAFEQLVVHRNTSTMSVAFISQEPFTCRLHLYLVFASDTCQ